MRSPAIRISRSHERTAFALKGAADNASAKIEVMAAAAVADIAPLSGHRHFSSGAVYAVASKGDPRLCCGRSSFPPRRIDFGRGTVGRGRLISNRGPKSLDTAESITIDTPVTEPESLGTACAYRLRAPEALTIDSVQTP